MTGDASHGQGLASLPHQGREGSEYDGLIHAHSREEAEIKGQAAFGATSQAEKAKVYVRET